MIFTALMFITFFASAETITLTSGKVIEGQIVERTDEFIKVDTGVDVVTTYYLDEIQSDNLTNSSTKNKDLEIDKSITMRIQIISKEPYVEERKFYVDNEEVAIRKYKTVWGDDEELPERVIMESIGQIPDGIATEYYPGKKVHYERSYKNGQQDDISKEYYKNGILKQEVMYADGKIHGKWKVYHPNGELKNVKIYVDGFIEGVTKQYNEDGKLTAELTRDRGKTSWWKTIRIRTPF